MKGSQYLTDDLCVMFIGFTKQVYCAIIVVTIIEAYVSTKLLSFHCTKDHSLATQTRKIMEITENKQRDLQWFSCDVVTCNHSIPITFWSSSLLREHTFFPPMNARPRETNPSGLDICTKLLVYFKHNITALLVGVSVSRLVQENSLKSIQNAISYLQGGVSTHLSSSSYGGADIQWISSSLSAATKLWLYI